jgi:hypothetical protein
MAEGITYGLIFPFNDSVTGDFLELSETQYQQIRSDLIVEDQDIFYLILEPVYMSFFLNLLMD